MIKIINMLYKYQDAQQRRKLYTQVLENKSCAYNFVQKKVKG